MNDINRQLTAIERRRLWKTGLRIAGAILTGIGIVLLPRTRQVFQFTEREQSFFSAIADTGAFAGWALGCIALGALALVVSTVIRGDESVTIG